jgi:hypothetical protein
MKRHHTTTNGEASMAVYCDDCGKAGSSNDEAGYTDTGGYRCPACRPKPEETEEHHYFRLENERRARRFKQTAQAEYLEEEGTEEYPIKDIISDALHYHHRAEVASSSSEGVRKRSAWELLFEAFENFRGEQLDAGERPTRVLDGEPAEWKVMR